MKDHDLDQVPCSKFLKDQWHQIEDFVPPEVEVHIHWNTSQRTLWAFPHDLHDLAMGHAALELCAHLQEPAYTDHTEGHFFLHPAPRQNLPAKPNFPPLPPPTVIAIMNRFLQRHGLWEQTGCFHRMAAYDPCKDEFTCFVEDIGRHNCVDRLTGWALRTSRTLENMILLSSSRITGSLMSKISKTGFPVIISRSATTRAAIELARSQSITLIGFSRGSRFTVFCDPEEHIQK